MEDREPKLSLEVIHNLKKKRKQTIRVDLITTVIPESGKIQNFTYITPLKDLIIIHHI